MNNFVFSQDPLLFQSVLPNQQVNFQEGIELKQQYDNLMSQYQNMQQKTNQNQVKDFLGELDSITKDIEPDVIEKLTIDPEYNRINNELQFMIQEEMLKSIKWKINNNTI